MFHTAARCARNIFIFVLGLWGIAPAAPLTEEAFSPLPGMPAILNPKDIYSEARAGQLSPVVKGFPPRIYVPNTVSNTVDVIDPSTFRVIDHLRVGRQPQHVTPSYDLRTLWVLNDLSDTLTKIDPATGKKGETVPVKDPYNMYYTPDGKYAIVVAERVKRLDFRDAATMKLIDSVPLPCRGVDHMDFSANGRYLIASCEFSGTIVKLDVAKRAVSGTLSLPLDQASETTSAARPVSRNGRTRFAGTRVHHGGGRMPVEAARMPQDVKTSPDGKLFYVADMMADGVHVIDGDKMIRVDFIPTGRGAHGLYASRDSRLLYCSNRDEGTISVISFEQRKVVSRWTIPGGGSPDMGGVSADGKVLWLSGRYHREVYAIDTTDGHLLARIPVGAGPHGLCVYPQPGRYSLGHTGVFR
jgi:YVTN family beta-propeller protein